MVHLPLTLCWYSGCVGEGVETNLPVDWWSEANTYSLLRRKKLVLFSYKQNSATKPHSFLNSKEQKFTPYCLFGYESYVKLAKKVDHLKIQ